MNSIGDGCNELKRQYDACFNNWFAEHFLKGSKDDSMCATTFFKYQECVKEAIKDQKIEISEVERDMLGTEHERQPPQKS